MKYGSKSTICLHGHKHASKREAEWCVILHNQQRKGEIVGLQVEPTFTFPPINGVTMKMGNGQLAKYRPDFSFVEQGRKVAVDVKGMIVRDFPLRAALFRACWPEIELRVVK